ncbi:hypothetical protein HJB96_09015 [Rhizobium sp. NLR15a]|uniref:hypothetical protein n=1 Tax=Rhizobium sp. NLR15a TaxID=2731111 RepID=UPI001C828523|nr:hypothetical protein [Rhizobium sp. NLR15a]MBX5293082.1 hypothetical protein [Rhizobium sp. NLR15a]
MTFSRIARVAAWLTLIVGASQLVLGVVIATEALLPYDQALARYAPGAPNSGSVIDRGIHKLIIAVALGTLAEISFGVLKTRGEQ